MMTRTMRQTIEGMPLVFDGAAAGDLEAVIQLDLSGDEPGAYHLVIGGGRCVFREGRAADPTLAIDAPAEVWGRISRGEIEGRDALLEGLYGVRGDARLLMHMDKLFRKAPEEAVAAPKDQRRPGPIPLRGGRWLTVAFIPWIVLWFSPPLGLSAAGGLALAFLAAAVLLTYHAANGRPTWFETGTVAVLGLVGALSLAPSGRAAWEAWGHAADTLALGIVWLSSLVPPRPPLTAEYSRWDHSPALWENSTFLHVNRVLTFLWGAVFVAMGGLSVAGLRWPDAAGTLGAARWLLLVPAIGATITLPRRASRLRIEDADGWRARFRFAALAGIVLAAGAAIAAGS
jgi:putative sterol carrier protein